MRSVRLCDDRGSVMILHLKNYRSYGFTIIELMISLLIITLVGLSYTNYMKKNQTTIRQSDMEVALNNEAGLIEKLLNQDLSQVARVNPSCADNPLTTGTSTACSDIKIKSGYVPLPGTTKTAVNALTDFSLPTNLEADTASLTTDSDGLRIISFDFSTTMNCRLNNFRSTNPSQTAGSTAGAERLWPLRSGCETNLAVGGLYLLMEQSSSTGNPVFSNIFQITAMSDLGGGATSVDQLQVDVASENNLFNQIGGLGLSGFSNAARIFPVKMIEWVLEPGVGLYRREIKPSSTNTSGYGTWKLVSDLVETAQFYPVTVSTAASSEHQRTMQFSADSSHNGVEDIRGVTARLILKSKQRNTSGVTYDNPITATDENDNYPRQEVRFYVDFKNAYSGS